MIQCFNLYSMSSLKCLRVSFGWNPFALCWRAKVLTFQAEEIIATFIHHSNIKRLLTIKKTLPNNR